MIARPLVARAALAAALLASSGAALGAMPVTPRGGADSTAAAEPSSMRGVYRVVLEEAGRAPVAATIVVERQYDQLEVSLLVDDRVSLLHSVKADGDTLQAKFSTAGGPATLSLRIDGNVVKGTMTSKHRAWKVTGERSA
jgi:hypothetical protein